MPLYNRDDGEKGLARRAAEARRTNLTEAVREALDRALDAYLDRLDALPDHPWSDTDMYDDDGIPR